MALSYPLLAAVAGLALAALLVLGLWWRNRRVTPRNAAQLANLERLTALPRYRKLEQRRRRLLTLELVGAVLLAGAVAVLVGRPVSTSAAKDTQNTRDIILCLDVSGSMSPTNAQVFASYIDLANRLQGERIGLVAFDSTAVTVFPLTDDAQFIKEQLTATAAKLGEPLPGTQLSDKGSSLISDGLSSCVNRFDQADQQRSRTIVLATDNQLSGTPLFTMDQAVARAAEHKIMVFGVAPGDNPPNVTADLVSALKKTGGDVLSLPVSGSGDVALIEQSVQQQEKSSTAQVEKRQPTDLIWPFAAFAAVGLLSLTIANWRRTR